MTPNHFEAELFSDIKLDSVSAVRQALQVIHERYLIPNVLISSVPVNRNQLSGLRLPANCEDHQVFLLCAGSTRVSSESASETFAVVFPKFAEHFEGTSPTSQFVFAQDTQAILYSIDVIIFRRWRCFCVPHSRTLQHKRKFKHYTLGRDSRACHRFCRSNHSQHAFERPEQGGKPNRFAAVLRRKRFTSSVQVAQHGVAFGTERGCHSPASYIPQGPAVSLSELPITPYSFSISVSRHLYFVNTPTLPTTKLR